MITVKSDFTDRVNEINMYFSFMENIITKNAQLVYPDGSNESINSDLEKIFKANSFLILYNLSESCIKNAIAEIYSTVNNEGVSYNDLKVGLKKEIISFLKKNINTTDFVSSINRIAYDIILNCFDSKKLISGNLDAKEIRKLASKYGFSCSIMPISNSDGSLKHVDSQNLLTVKRNRNDLAHGTYSFTDCGKNYSMPDLLIIKNDVVAYLKQVLDHIEFYINNRGYLESTTP
jgi:hypothetical protein